MGRKKRIYYIKINGKREKATISLEKNVMDRLSSSLDKTNPSKRATDKRHNQSLNNAETSVYNILNPTYLRARRLASDIQSVKNISINPIQNSLKSARDYIDATYGIYKHAPDLQEHGTAKVSAFYTGEKMMELISQNIMGIAENAFNRYCSLQEDYISQQTVSNVMGTINRVKGFGESVISGISSGAKTAGIPGAIIGGVASAADFGINQYMNYQKRMSGYYQQLNATNFQTQFSANRMGLINNGRGTEN